MRRLREAVDEAKGQRNAVLQAVARRFSATWEADGAASPALVTIAGKPVAIEIAEVNAPARGHGPRARVGLRFDKVVVRLVGRLRAGLGDAVPNGLMVVVTVTAPIRLPAKTVDALEQKIRLLLARRPHRTAERGRIHGNGVRIQLEKTYSTHAPKVLGFVHNPDSDPRALLETTHALLEVFHRRARRNVPKRFAGDRWLVLVNADEHAHGEVCRVVYSQLRLVTDLKKILMVFRDGHIETLK